MTDSPQHPNAELLDRFYAAFARSDGAAMAACYARDAQFSDPVFVGLRGAEPGAMWRMLTSRAKDFSVDLASASADDEAGAAHWIARYRFAQTGRPVVNEVRSTFRFAEGLIAQQRDHFDFYRWSRQALGAQGLLLGRTPVLRRGVRSKARAALDAYLASHPETSG